MKVHSLLDSLGLSYIWSNQVHSIESFKRIVKQRLRYLSPGMCVTDTRHINPNMYGAWSSGKVSDRNWSKMQDLGILVWFMQYLSL